MAFNPQHLFLTGPPNCGKTTAIRGVVNHLPEIRLAGFFTQEIRRAGKRHAFEMIGFGGTRATLASVDSLSQLRVSRYGVELSAVEQIVHSELQVQAAEVDLFVVDEIGKMECYSPLFIEVMRNILDGDVPVLGTIALYGGGFIAEVKQRSDVEVITVTQENRDSLPVELAAKLS